MFQEQDGHEIWHDIRCDSENTPIYQCTPEASSLRHPSHLALHFLVGQGDCTKHAFALWLSSLSRPSSPALALSSSTACFKKSQQRQQIAGRWLMLMQVRRL
jgi:hypothetical protein